jgi:hypothetical protein
MHELMPSLPEFEVCTLLFIFCFVILMFLDYEIFYLDLGTKG